MTDGGYDEGYRCCSCFWGTAPAEMVCAAAKHFDSAATKCALDLGCGEGKNSVALARAGFRVVALDTSELAIHNAMRAQGDAHVTWLVCDLCAIRGPIETYDVVVATGSLHCLQTKVMIEHAVANMKAMTRRFGLNVISSFNDGPQDFGGHSPSFRPTLLSHAAYLRMYDDWEILQTSDNVQGDSHPHNGVSHSHSITRLLARRG